MRQQLDFSADSSVSYITSDEQVIRNGNDTLRLASDGTVTFTAADDGGSRYPVAGAGYTGRWSAAVSWPQIPWESWAVRPGSI